MRTVRSFLAALGCVVAIVFAHAATVPSLLYAPDTVVVSRGNAQITFRDIDEYMQRVPPDKRAGVLDSPQRIQALLLNMLLNEQLVAQAEKMGLDRDPSARGKTGWERVEVLSKLRMQRFMQDIKVPNLEELAREEYVGHREKYTDHGARQVQRIFISAHTLGDKDAWKLASSVRDQVVADPTQFDALVAKYSDEPDKASSHGLIADAQQHAPDRWFAEALESLKKPGDLSMVVPAEGGYQILKLVAVAPDAVKPFPAVHDALVKELQQNYIESTRRDFLDNLASEKMDADPAAVASLRSRYSAAVGAPHGAPAAAAGPDVNPGNAQR